MNSIKKNRIHLPSKQLLWTFDIFDFVSGVPSNKEPTNEYTCASTSSTNNRSGKYLHALKTNFYLFSLSLRLSFSLRRSHQLHILSEEWKCKKKNEEKIETQRKWLTASLSCRTIIVCNHVCVCVRETHFTLKTSTQSAIQQPSTSNTFSFPCVYAYMSHSSSNWWIYQRQRDYVKVEC